MSTTSKKDICRTIILNGSSVFVHLNGTKVKSIPTHLQSQEQVVLQFGHNMPIPITDFWTDDFGISGTLSFKGQPHYCEVPWSAVWALVGEDSKGMVYEAEIPLSVRREIDANKVAKKEPLKLVSTKLPALASVRNITSNRVPTSKANRPSHLRLVK